MAKENTPITQAQQRTLSESQLAQILKPKYWVGLPRASEKKKLQSATFDRLDQDKVDTINSRIQSSLTSRSRLVYRTDRHTHVIDPENNVYYSLNQNSLAVARIRPSKSVDIPIYSGSIDAQLSIAGYLAFFNIQVNGNTFTQRFYPQDSNSIPIIYSVSQRSQIANIIFAASPYKKDCMLLGLKKA